MAGETTLSEEQVREIARTVAREVLVKARRRRPRLTPRLTEAQVRKMAASLAATQDLVTMGRPPSVQGVKTRAVRLDQESEDILTGLAGQWRCSYSEAIRRIIRGYHKAFCQDTGIVATPEGASASPGTPTAQPCLGAQQPAPVTAPSGSSSGRPRS